MTKQIKIGDLYSHVGFMGKGRHMFEDGDLVLVIEEKEVYTRTVFIVLHQKSGKTFSTTPQFLRKVS
jgi:transcription elongation factor